MLAAIAHITDPLTLSENLLSSDLFYTYSQDDLGGMTLSSSWPGFMPDAAFYPDLTLSPSETDVAPFPAAVRSYLWMESSPSFVMATGVQIDLTIDGLHDYQALDLY